MARNPETETTLTLQMSEADKAMIKADAKALGMVPSRYVSMVCRLLNETAREDATKEFANSLTRSVLESFAK